MQSVAEAVNVAYTSVGLDPHVDLVYYESAPGLQFLHCLEFDPEVTGGDSTFVDGLEVAEIIRDNHPEDFEVLCSVPATFEKVHSARENPVHMQYHRTHIVTNHLGQVCSFVVVFVCVCLYMPITLPISRFLHVC